MGRKDSKPEWFGDWNGLYHFLKIIYVYTRSLRVPNFWGTYRVHGQCYHQHYKKKGGVSTLDNSCCVGLKIQDHPMVNEEKPKVDGGAKPKGRRFQQST